MSTAFGEKHQLNATQYIELKRIYNEDIMISPLNELWLFNAIGIPSNDPEEAIDGYEPLDYDTYQSILISAYRVDEAISLFMGRLSHSPISYDESHWTLDRIGIDTRPEVNTPNIVIDTRPEVNTPNIVIVDFLRG